MQKKNISNGDLVDAFSTLNQKWEIAIVQSYNQNEDQLLVSFLSNNQISQITTQISQKQIDYLTKKILLNQSAKQEHFYMVLNKKYLADLLNQTNIIFQKPIQCYQIIQFIRGKHLLSLWTLLQQKSSNLDPQLIFSYFETCLNFFCNYLKYIVQNSQVQVGQLFCQKNQDIYKSSILAWKSGLQQELKNVNKILALEHNSLFHNLKNQIEKFQKFKEEWIRNKLLPTLTYILNKQKILSEIYERLHKFISQILKDQEQKQYLKLYNNVLQAILHQISNKIPIKQDQIKKLIQSKQSQQIGEQIIQQIQYLKQNDQKQQVINKIFKQFIQVMNLKIVLKVFRYLKTTNNQIGLCVIQRIIKFIIKLDKKLQNQLQNMCQLINKYKQYPTQIIPFLEYLLFANLQNQQLQFIILRLKYFKIKYLKQQIFQSQYENFINVLARTPHLKDPFLNFLFTTISFSGICTLQKSLAAKIIHTLGISDPQLIIQNKWILKIISSVDAYINEIDYTALMKADLKLIHELYTYNNRMGTKEETCEILELYMDLKDQLKKYFIISFIKNQTLKMESIKLIYEQVCKKYIKYNNLIDANLVLSCFLFINEHQENIKYKEGEYLLCKPLVGIQKLISIYKQAQYINFRNEIINSILKLFANIQTQQITIIQNFIQIFIHPTIYHQELNYFIVNFINSFGNYYQINQDSSTRAKIYYTIQINQKYKYLQFPKDATIGLVRRKVSQLVFQEPKNIYLFDEDKNSKQFQETTKLKQLKYDKKQHIEFKIRDQIKNKLKTICHNSYYVKLYELLPQSLEIILTIGPINEQFKNKISNFNESDWNNIVNKEELCYQQVFCILANLEKLTQLSLNSGLMNFFHEKLSQELNLITIEVDRKILKFVRKIPEEFHNFLINFDKVREFQNKLISIITNAGKLITYYQQLQVIEQIDAFQLLIDSLETLDQLFGEPLDIILACTDFCSIIELISDSLFAIRNEYKNWVLFDYKQYLIHKYLKNSLQISANIQQIILIVVDKYVTQRKISLDIIIESIIEIIKNSNKLDKELQYIQNNIVCHAFRPFFKDNKDYDHQDVEFRQIQLAKQLLIKFPILIQQIRIQNIFIFLENIVIYSQEQIKQFFQLLIQIIKNSDNRPNILNFFHQQFNRYIHFVFNSKLFIQNQLNSDQFHKQRGIINPRFICYMNALLQQLHKNQSFREQLLKMNWTKDSNKQLDSIYQLKNIFLKLKYSKATAIDISNFYKIWKDSEGNYTNINVQSDTSQFFMKLIEHIERLFVANELVKQNIVKTHFDGVLQNKLEAECKHISIKKEPFNHLNLQVKNFKNLKQSFNSYFRGEVFEGEDSYYCEQCKTKLKAIKTCKIIQYPKTLVIVLKRLQFYLENLKILTKLEFPIDQLTLNSEYGCQIQQKYRLKGVIIHSGKTPSAGHYYSFIKIKNQWKQFNDRKVKNVSIQQVKKCSFGLQDQNKTNGNSDQAYLLFYEKLQESNLIEQERQKYLDCQEMINKIITSNFQCKIKKLFEKNIFQKFLTKCNENLFYLSEIQMFSLQAIITFNDYFSLESIRQICAQLIHCQIDHDKILTMINNEAIIKIFLFNLDNKQMKKNKCYTLELLIHYLKSIPFDQIKKFLNMLIYLTYTKYSKNYIYYILWILSNQGQNSSQIRKYLQQKNIIGRILDVYFHKSINNQELLKRFRIFSDLGYEIDPIQIDKHQQIQESFRWCLVRELLQHQYTFSAEQYNLIRSLNNRKLLLKFFHESTIKMNISNINFFLSFLSQKFTAISHILIMYLQSSFQEASIEQSIVFHRLCEDLLKINDGQQTNRFKKIFEIYKKLIDNEYKSNLKKCMINIQWFYKILKNNSKFKKYISNIDSTQIQFLYELQKGKRIQSESTNSPKKNNEYEQLLKNRIYGLQISIKYNQIYKIIRETIQNITSLIFDDGNHMVVQNDNLSNLFYYHQKPATKLLYFELQENQFKKCVVQEAFGSMLKLNCNEYISFYSIFDQNILRCDQSEIQQQLHLYGT